MQQRIDLQALAKRLLANGYTTRTLAAAIGLSQPSVSRLASGVTRDIDAQAALRLIQIAGGSISLPAGAAEARDAA